MNKPLTVEIRVNNTVFECALEKKFYNAQERRPFAVGRIMGVMPNPRTPGQFGIASESMIICENCYNENKDEKGLHFEDPSNLVMPTNEAMSKLNLKKNWGDLWTIDRNYD